jgi:glycolate oxidase
VETLRSALPAGRVVTDPDLLEGVCHDEARFTEAGHPAALVRPASTSEVQEVLRIAQDARVPVVPRGAGSGLAGGANAVEGCLVLSLLAMNRILEIDRRSLIAVAQPGVVNADLGAAARAEGLWYPPDPASFETSTLGGNVATNAGGLCCVKYGVTGDSVLGLEVVLAGGRALRAGRRSLKGVAGYDLTRLLVGSEGTLGVVTEITLRLRPRPRPAATLAAFFPTLAAAGEAVTSIVDRLTPSLLELMDRRTVRAVEALEPMDLDTEAAALLFARSDAGGAEGAAEAEAMEACCQAAGASFVATTAEAGEGEMMLAARRLAYPALERQGAALLDDVAVPVGRLAELLSAIERIAEEQGVEIGTFGHAGDGNMHPTIVFDPRDPDSEERARSAFDAIVARTLELGGTVTGEHGVGLLKRGHLEREIGPVGLELHRAIKAAFDPNGILNPGKLF